MAADIPWVVKWNASCNHTGFPICNRYLKATTKSLRFSSAQRSILPCIEPVRHNKSNVTSVFFICHCCWSWFITTRPCNIMEAITSISLSKRRFFYKITRQIVFPNVLIFCSLKGCLAAMLPQTSAKFQSIRKRQHSFPAHLRVGCYDKTSYVIYCLPITNIAFHFISTKGSLRDALYAFLNQLQRNRLVCESSCVTEHFPYDMLTISFTACWSKYIITRRWLYVIYWQSNL